MTTQSARAGQSVRISAAIEHWPFLRPFRITGHVFDGVDVLVATVEAGGLQGRAEAAGVYYRGETAVTLAAQVASLAAGVNTLSRQELLQAMPAGGARNAVDCALWDLEAKQARQPVWQLAKLPGTKPLLTTFTIGADDPNRMAALACGMAGAKALKLKLLGDGGDAERVRAVHRARPDAWLGVDANQGFTPASYHDLLPALVAARVQLVEQPFPTDRDADLDGLGSPIPLAADESVQDHRDIERFVGRVDVINIKLDKCGGLTEALAMVATARACGLKLMVGNMLGTSLSTAPGFVLGQLCDLVDLDGPTFLAQDRTPSVVYANGLIDCADTVWGSAAPRHAVPQETLT
jgi:L-alanine-DL-glutamate epimerase-like enolase superfamily enzyme